MDAQEMHLQTPTAARAATTKYAPGGMVRLPARRGGYLPPHLRTIRVVSGMAWVVYLEQDYWLNPEMEMTFAPGTDVMVVALWDEPLVLEAR